MFENILIFRHMRKKFAGSGRDKSRLIFQMLLKNNMQVALALLKTWNANAQNARDFSSSSLKIKTFFANVYQSQFEFHLVLLFKSPCNCTRSS
jgi:hypothetical protein